MRSPLEQCSNTAVLREDQAHVTGSNARTTGVKGAMIKQIALPAVLLVGLCETASIRGQAPVEPPFVLRQVGPSVFAAIHNPNAKEPSYANAGFVIGDDGVAVIDTFANSGAATHLLSEIRR